MYGSGSSKRQLCSTTAFASSRTSRCNASVAIHHSLFRFFFPVKLMQSVLAKKHAELLLPSKLNFKDITFLLLTSVEHPCKVRVTQRADDSNLASWQIFVAQTTIYYCVYSLLFVRMSSRVATSLLKIALEIDCESAFVTTLFHCFSQEEVFRMLARFNL